MRLSFADGLFWTSAACCVVAQLCIIRSVHGARHLPAPSTGMPRQHGALEMLWAVLPAVALAFLMLFTWRAMQRTSTVTPPAAVSAVKVAA